MTNSFSSFRSGEAWSFIIPWQIWHIMLKKYQHLEFIPSVDILHWLYLRTETLPEKTSKQVCTALEEKYLNI